jgi:hypothetical protein
MIQQHAALLVFGLTVLSLARDLFRGERSLFSLTQEQTVHSGRQDADPRHGQAPLTLLALWALLTRFVLLWK